MGRKKPEDWLNTDYSGKKTPKPTLRQYLKELPKNVTDIKSTVRVIWLPGQWQNYTLQCDDFRVIVSEGHKLFDGLRANVNDFTKGTQTLDVLVTNREPLSFRLAINPEVTGEWFFIGGESGLMFTQDVGGSGGTETPW